MSSSFTTYNSSNSNYTSLLFDSNTVNSFNQTGACFASVSSAAGYMFNVKGLDIFFKDSNTNVPSYTVGLSITGVNQTGQTVLISNFDANAHSGWNAAVFSGLYSTIQVNGTGCDLITELSVRGDVLMNTTNTTVTCGVTLNQVAAPMSMGRRNLLSVTQTITYNSALTNVITSISPAFGSAAGGDTLTITGTGLSTSLQLFIGGAACLNLQ